jgi:hypothetical protein
VALARFEALHDGRPGLYALGIIEGAKCVGLSHLSADQLNSVCEAAERAMKDGR